MLTWERQTMLFIKLKLDGGDAVITFKHWIMNSFANKLLGINVVEGVGDIFNMQGVFRISNARHNHRSPRRVNMRSLKSSVFFWCVIKIHLTHGKLKTTLRKITRKKRAIFPSLKHGAFNLVELLPILIFGILVVKNAKLFVPQAKATKTVLTLVTITRVLHADGSPDSNAVFAILTVHEINRLVRLATSARPNRKRRRLLIQTGPRMKQIC